MRRPAIDRLLPTTYQQAAGPGTVLGGLLDAMERLHAPDEDLLDRVEDIAAPYRAPDQLVPYLARWVVLDHLSSARIPVGRLRDLVANGADLARWRGTRRGLVRFLEIATGVPGFSIEEPRPFAFVVRVPEAAADQGDLIRRIVEAEKPAATTYEVALSQGTT
ncbi:phage tail protein [Actinopolymorpha pittospori]|uniref:Phage tail-like protein n=1 Tax=Actinopolymorpha pittospori TaxID=648752 RepID=A0A927MTH1_9ACTN|nr:phage tail protein [Actinopolymorpha pittospori]MBE1604528.1 phage tail-like protein [Actinopolymorpha pittospori]